MKYDLRLDLDTRCNLQCTYCDNRDIPNEEKGSLDLGALEPLLPAINEHCWSVYLSCGGEPTLHPRFREFLQQLGTHLNKPDISIVTNAILLNESNRKALLESPVNRVLVSIDSHDPAIFSRLCGTNIDIANRIYSNLEQFALERTSMRNPPHLIVTAIAMKSTLTGLPELATWLRKIGVSCFNVQWLNPLNYAEMRAEVLNPNSFEVRSTLAEIRRALKGSKVLLDWPREISIDKLGSVWNNRILFKNRVAYLRTAVRKAFARRLGFPCVHANNTFYLNPKGEFNMCPNAAMALDFPRNSSQFTSILQSIAPRIHQNQPARCANCSERNI